MFTDELLARERNAPPPVAKEHFAAAATKGSTGKQIPVAFSPCGFTRYVFSGFSRRDAQASHMGRAEADFHHAKVVTKIAFGSCFDPRDKESSIFDAILKHRPDAFVFLGDNIYGDTNDMQVLRAKYAELEAVEGFRKLRDATTVLATWDDHDYGTNDGGKSYPMREESEKIFLDFFKDPADSPRRAREGVYASHTFGPEGRTCQIILLDTRYFRDELPRTKRKPAAGTVGWYEPTDDTNQDASGRSPVAVARPATRSPGGPPHHRKQHSDARSR